MNPQDPRSLSQRSVSQVGHLSNVRGAEVGGSGEQRSEGAEVSHRDMDPHSGQLAETSQGPSWSVLAAITKIP